MTEKQLITVLTEVEAVVNSRPLVYVGSDINSSFLISPMSFLSLNRNHFILDFTCSDHEDPEFKTTENISTAQQILERWKSGQRCLKQFWKIWRNEYLLSLRERGQIWHKKSKGALAQVPKIGDVVLFKEKLPWGQWKVGRINKLIKGRDQLVRSAKVMISSKKLLSRALNMLYPIEFPETEAFENKDDISPSQKDEVIPVEITEDTDEHVPCDKEVESDEADRDSDYEDTNRIDSGTQPTRRAVVAAREKIRKWLNPVDDELVGVVSVADHANDTNN